MTRTRAAFSLIAAYLVGLALFIPPLVWEFGRWVGGLFAQLGAVLTRL